MEGAMPEILQTRGGIDGTLATVVEARHPWSALAVVDGQVVWRAGEDLETTWRSAAKPLQLAVCLELLGKPNLCDEELAIGAASHSGEPGHLRWVREVLARFDVAEADLRCGTHPPVHEPSAQAILRAEADFSAIHNNCSGKHAFMLAASARQRWPLDYRSPDHPLQQRILAQVAEWTGAQPKLAVDGCGVPTFGLALSAIAQGWCKVAEEMALPTDAPLLGAIGRAMAAQPWLMSGTGRLDESIVRHASEPMAVKVGAQGLFCIALPKRRMGLAVKVHSGSSEALPAAVASALHGAVPEAWAEPPDWRLREVRNVEGLLVGLFGALRG
jgi:L-asparaginase II